MLENRVKSYSTGSKVFHWLIAVIVIFMLAFSFFLGDLQNSVKPTAYMIHKSFGLTVLGLMILRVIWIIKSGRPKLPSHIPFAEKLLSRVVQYSLYVFLFAMPIVGWVMSAAAGKIPVFFGLFKMPLPIAKNESLAKLMSETHETIAFILIGLIILHIVGAWKHYLIDKDEVMQSML